MEEKTVWQVIKTVGAIVGATITYGSAIGQVLGVEMLELDWGWWVIIGFSIFAGTIFAILRQLRLEVKKLTSDAAKQTRRERQLRIKNLEWEALSRDIDTSDIE
jgi:phosphate/sulfate permease